MSDTVSLWLLIAGVECVAWLLVLVVKVVLGHVR